jgi:hypothetical protein
MSGSIAVVGWFTILAADGGEASSWPTRGIIGGFLLSVGIVAWLAIAFYFTLGVVPRLHQVQERKQAGSLTVPLFENYYLIGLYLQFMSFFGALDLAIAAYFGFAGQLEAWLWLGLCAFLILLSIYGRWGLTPAMQTTVMNLQEAATEASRQQAENALRRKHSLAKALNVLQILAGLVILGLFVPASTVPSAPPPQASRVAAPPASQPASGPKVIRRMSPSGPSPVLRSTTTVPAERKANPLN